MLGLCVRAGECVFGAAQCEKAIKSGKAKLVILDGVVSENTRKQFTQLCNNRNTVLIILQEEERLGRSIGKENIRIIGVVNSGFSKNILKKFEEGSDRSSEKVIR